MAAANEAAWAAVWAGAAVVPVGRGGWIRVRGEDRVRWLNGMVTNSIVGLEEGQGCLNLLLSAQGRIQGTAWAFRVGEELWLETDAAQAEGMVAMLDRFVIMDDVELEDVSGAWEGLVLLGPQAGLELRSVGLEVPEGTGSALRREGEATVVRKAGRLRTRWEVWGPKEGVARARERLLEAGVVEGGAEVLEGVRLLEGVPRFGADIREKELAQETGMAEALHFSKGCYLGQEIVERVRSRGSVHRAFAGVELGEGELPAVGAAVMAGDKQVGELTTVGVVPAFPGRAEGMRIGLGYLRREAMESRDELRVEGAVVRVVGLPMPIGATTHQKEG